MRNGSRSHPQNKTTPWTGWGTSRPPEVASVLPLLEEQIKQTHIILGDTSISILSRDPSFQKTMRTSGETAGF